MAKKGVLAATVCVLMLTGSVLAPQILAVEETYGTAVETTYTESATDETLTETESSLTGESGTDASSESTQSDSSVSEYNLADEDWDELLNEETGTASQAASSKGASTEEETSVSNQLVSNAIDATKSSDGGFSKAKLFAILSFGLAAVALFLFIWVVFIHRHRMKKKYAELAEKESAAQTDAEDEDVKMDLNFDKPDSEGDSYDPAKRVSTERIAVSEKEVLPEELKARRDSSLSEEDEKKLKQVDWDQFLK